MVTITTLDQQFGLYTCLYCKNTFSDRGEHNETIGLDASGMWGGKYRTFILHKRTSKSDINARQLSFTF
jgi:hypothetical protein